MIELQILNKLLLSNTIKPLLEHGITADQFLIYSDEFEFIQQHYTKFNNMPDKETLIDKFPNFDFITVDEDWTYLSEKMTEQHAFNKLVPILQEGAKVAESNSIDALHFLEEKLYELKNSAIKEDLGINIIEKVDERVTEYKQRIDSGDLLGISTGLKDLDDVMLGMLPGEDLITVLGRPNQGKSWIMQYFLTAAWKQGCRVLHYSGEMGHHLVGFRFDTLNAHFSNNALMRGLPDIKDDYVDYGSKLDGPPYSVIMPQHLGGNLLDVRSLEQMIQIHNPDVIGVDQLTLMRDIRGSKSDSMPTRLGHISQDLFNLSEKYKKPIIMAHQATRNSAKRDDEEAPGIGDSYGSDGVEQASSRILGIRRVPVGIKITISKNRYGENNREFIYTWDIDKGIITDTPIAVEDERQAQYTEGTDIF